MRNPNALMELYVHIPFCIKKCDYCDFLSGPANAETQNNYVEALLTEISKSGDFSEERSPLFLSGEERLRQCSPKILSELWKLSEDVLFFRTMQRSPWKQIQER